MKKGLKLKYIMEYSYLILYQGSSDALMESLSESDTFIPLLGNFGVIRSSYEVPMLLSRYPMILYAELSRPLYPSYFMESASNIWNYNTKEEDIFYKNIWKHDITKENQRIKPCAFPNDPSINGAGTVIAVIDSGLDYRHPDFIDADGKTRILSYWDQTLPYDGVNPYKMGRIFSEEEIDSLLQRSTSLSPSNDISGHGTHVAGICCGNGRASSGRNMGVAPGASLLIVKLKNDASGIFTDYTSLITAIDYSVRYCATRNLPCTINLSYGTNYGSHSGESLLERYISNCGYYGKNVICVATGNEGLSRKHTQLLLTPKKTENIIFSIAPGERSYYLQIWIPSIKDIRFDLYAPGNTNSFSFDLTPGNRQATLGENNLFFQIEDASPYVTLQSVFITMQTSDSSSFLTPGIWTLRCYTESLVSIPLELWMPTREATSSESVFLDAVSSFTMTVPSTARDVISVSGYDSSTDTFAPFSGQGYLSGEWTKPDLCAPAVNILSTIPGGGYGIKTGTSMAVAFVSGTCALLMEYGIVQKNDPFLYGAKIKSYLRKNALPLPAFSVYPNTSIGWGRLNF